MHAVALIGTAAWFVVLGLFWYTKPGEVLWLAGSLVLGVIYFVGFFYYVTRPR
jgi:hypothetical protein